MLGLHYVTYFQTVNGGPLPPNILHQPISSFDDTGRFQAGDITVVPDAPEPSMEAEVTKAAPAAEPTAPEHEVTKWKPIPSIESSEVKAETPAEPPSGPEYSVEVSATGLHTLVMNALC